MRKLNKLIFPFIVLIMAATVSFAQGDGKQEKKKSSFDKYWYINANAGVTNFYGDIYQKNILVGDERLAYGGRAGYQFSPVFGLRANFMNGKFQSTSGTGDERDKDLNTLTDELLISLWDVSGQLTVDFTNIFRDNKDGWFGIYGFGGVGYANFSSMRLDKETKAISKDQNGNEYRNGSYSDNEGGGMSGAETTITFPAGMGMYFNISPKVAINLESQLSFTNEDNKMDMQEGGAMAVKNDFYGYTSLGLTYKFRSGSGLKKMKKDCEKVKYEVTPEVLEAQGSKVEFTINITFPEKYFGKKSALRFAPELRYGEETMALPAKFFKGEKVEGSGTLVPYNEGGTYSYTATFDYTPEMAQSELYVTPLGFDPKKPVDTGLTEEDIKANTKNLEMCETKLADGIRNSGSWAGGNETTTLSDHGYELETVVSSNAILYFPKNRANYSKNFGANKSEVSKEHRQAIDDFLAQGWDIKDITVNAYASPEGEETFNANLSENRAKTGSSYIEKEIKKLAKKDDSNMGDVSEINYIAVGNGPDWDGFMTALQNSNIEDKNTMINVIKSAAPEKKEEEIRNMILIYPELEDDILSPIRRAEITANCYEPKRSAEEISQLATTDPQKLTEEELLYAATLTEDDNAKAAIYKAAIEKDHNKWEAQNNAAIVDINQGNFGAALDHLDKANELSPNNPSVINNYGVVYAKQGNWKKAEENFNSAKSLGENNSYNLGVIAIQNGEYEKALSLFGSTKCDFNVALAHMMLEQYDKANDNLNCANENCKTNYLQAVVAARQGNDDVVYTHLKKALEINPKLKARAASDREFIKYQGNEDFMNIVK